jgi:alpha-tubulin suppressor-like RCC1 family protein
VITDMGGVECWGLNQTGWVGEATPDRVVSPRAIPGLSTGIDAVAPGYFHMCARTLAGHVECVGENFYGALGNGTTKSSLTLVDVIGF